MTPYDYAVIAFYFAFMLAISVVVRRFVSNVSDYFRGGGQVVWWMTGGSAFMVSFSAWTFTGGASKAYTDGWPILVIYLGNAVGFLMNAAWFAPRFRQMRVITAIEAVRARFGAANEQFFTWLQIPLGTLYAGIWLNGLGVFVAAVFDVNLSLTIAATGLVVLLVALISGSWAVVASDFIQVLILMPVTVVAALLAVAKVGGVGAFFARAPAGHFHFAAIYSDKFLLLWCAAILIKQFVSTNTMTEASRYLCVKDGHHARKAALLGAALFLVGPVLWFVPPIATAILHPHNLGALFPKLANPSEASFIAVCLETMPAGMIGLLICGIFAATMSSMDSGLNRNAGIFVKNFYQPVLRPRAPESELMLTGKLATIALGILVILAALKFSHLRNLGLFNLMLEFGVLVAFPCSVPLIWGMLVKGTPPWAGWSTVLAGFASSLAATYYFDAAWVRHACGLAHPLTAAAASNWAQGFGVLLNLVVGSAWFLGTRFFARRNSAAYDAQVEQFFTDFSTPVDYAREMGAASDHRQSAVIGWLCLVYGGFVLLLALIPNPLDGRLGFVFCGGVVVLVGGALLRFARRPPAAEPAPSPLAAASAPPGAST